MSDDSETAASDEVEIDGTSGFSTNFETTDLGDEESNQGLFDDLLSGEPIFENKEVLRPSYTPHELPHRSDQINKMATILVAALRGETPSNILIYGKTGTGKTASAKFVSKELESTSQKYSVPCDVEYINCEVTDTQYRVLAQLANKFIEKNEARIDERLADLESLLEAIDDYDAADTHGTDGTRATERADDQTASDPFDFVSGDETESRTDNPRGDDTGNGSSGSPPETEGSVLGASEGVRDEFGLWELLAFRDVVSRASLTSSAESLTASSGIASSARSMASSVSGAFASSVTASRSVL